MPTRTTRSRSYSYKLFGVRHTVRRTTTNGGSRSGGVSTQIHLTGRDLIEMERQRREDVAALQLEAAQAHQTAMRNLSPLAVKVHTAPLAAASLVVLAVATLIWLAMSGSAATSSVGDVFLFVAYAISAGLFAVDWHDVTTLHGKINWPLLRYNRGNGPYWLAVCCYGLFAFIPAAIYLIQCLQLGPAVREAQHVKLQEDIARLEKELSAAQDANE